MRKHGCGATGPGRVTAPEIHPRPRALRVAGRTRVRVRCRRHQSEPDASVPAAGAGRAQRPVAQGGVVGAALPGTAEVARRIRWVERGVVHEALHEVGVGESSAPTDITSAMPSANPTDTTDPRVRFLTGRGAQIQTMLDRAGERDEPPLDYSDLPDDTDVLDGVPAPSTSGPVRCRRHRRLRPHPPRATTCSRRPDPAGPDATRAPVTAEAPRTPAVPYPVKMRVAPT